MKIAIAVALRAATLTVFAFVLATAPDVTIRALGAFLAGWVFWDIAHALEAQDGLVVITEYDKPTLP